MKEITTTVYTIDELSPEAKEQARKWYKDGNQYDDLSNYLDEHLVELLAENKITTLEKPHLYYSLTCCQGDGAMFAGTVEWKGNTFIIRQQGHYYHSNSKSIEIADFEGTPAEEEKILNEFELLYTTICKKLERIGYDYIDHENSDDHVDEILQANEYTFTSNGERFG